MNKAIKLYKAIAAIAKLVKADDNDIANLIFDNHSIDYNVRADVSELIKELSR